MQLVPIVALGALLFYLFKPDEESAPPAPSINETGSVSSPTPGVDVSKAQWQPVVHSNPRSGRCFSKIDRAGFSTDLINS